MMKAHILQHVSFEGPGSILSWLEQQNATVSYSYLFDPTTELPEPESFDLLIVMGGPMSVNDESVHPWLAAEKQFIARAISNGIPTVGICLGAQLIANAHGAKIYPGPAKEIGWWPIQATPAQSGFEFPAESTVFHWHGETCDLPAGAQRLASSGICKNQAFQLGRNAIGLQFHLETTPSSAAAIIEHCGDELVTAETVQSAEQILSIGELHYQTINTLMGKVLNYLTR